VRLALDVNGTLQYIKRYIKGCTLGLMMQHYNDIGARQKLAFTTSILASRWGIACAQWLIEHRVSVKTNAWESKQCGTNEQGSFATVVRIDSTWAKTKFHY
jgi:hypothetical protein